MTRMRIPSTIKNRPSHAKPPTIKPLTIRLMKLVASPTSPPRKKAVYQVAARTISPIKRLPIPVLFILKSNLQTNASGIMHITVWHYKKIWLEEKANP